MTPAAFSGVWRRQGLRVAQGETLAASPQPGAASEPGIVLWIQAGERFVDIRFSDPPHQLAGPGAFAGHTSFVEPFLTWHHQIDLPPSPEGDAAEAAADVGHIEWLDDHTILERGGFDTPDGPVAYEERWCRDPIDGEVLVLHQVNGTGLAIGSGSHLVGMASTPAGPTAQGPDGWSAVHLELVSGLWKQGLGIGAPEACRGLTDSLLSHLEGTPNAAVTQTPYLWRSHDPSTVFTP